MASIRLSVDATVVYEGPTIAVPRVGDGFTHDGNVVRVEAVVWDFAAADDVVLVTLVVSEIPYSF